MAFAPVDTKKDRKARLRLAQKAWVNQLAAARNMTLHALARAIGAEPSSLARFVKDDDKASVLDSLTIATIVETLGETPPPNIVGAADMAEKARGLREPEAAPYVVEPSTEIAEALHALTGNKPWLVAWELKTRAIEAEGYHPGDIVIVDLNAAPRDGDIVCAQLYNWQDPGKTETIFRLYDAPYLITSGQREEHRKPELVDNQRVVIKGVISHSLRPRRR